MTSVGDIITIVETTIAVINAAQTVHNAGGEMKELHDRTQILADTLAGFVDVSGPLTDDNQRLYYKTLNQIENRMTSLRKRLRKEDNAWKKAVSQVLWVFKKKGVIEDIEAIEKLEGQVRKVFQTQNIQG